MNELTVVYLSWIPYGICELEGFLQSYNQHPAAAPHTLVILFNGVTCEDDYQPFLKKAKDMLNKPVDYLVLSSGQDIDAYFFAAKNLNSSRILFLNTYSRILAGNWLHFYLDAFKLPKVGLVGATCSAMSYYSAVFQKNTWKWERSVSFNEQLRKYRLLIKAAIYWRFLFPSFPNYHLRTNAFMIDRRLFMQLKCPSLNTKFQAYRFESGFNSMTRQIMKRNLEVRVLDSNGNSYPINEVAGFPIFWKGNQELLLVADNQTMSYTYADTHQKSFLEYLAWGKTSS